MPRRRPSLGGDARHRAPVVIVGAAEYGLFFLYMFRLDGEEIGFVNKSAAL